MQNRSRNRRRHSEQGYILITLTLFVALLAIAALAVAPTLTFRIKRDREEEMIHRGVQYSRAIQKYFKKFGRYPVSLDNLVNTNNQRFLRKRLKMPMAGRDFRTSPLRRGSNDKWAEEWRAQPQSPPWVEAECPEGPGMNSNNGQGFGLSSGPSQAQPQNSSAGDTQEDATSGSSPAGKQSASSSTPTSPQIVGGPIVGVTSFSKETSIREFGGKNHYNQWQFTYDPTMQQLNGLIKTPAQPLQQGMAANINGQGAQGLAGGWHGHRQLLRPNRSVEHQPRRHRQ